MLRLVLLTAAALGAASGGPSVDTSPALPADVADKFAIFKANSAATTSTSFTLEHTKITITKKHSATSSATTLGRRPRIVVSDAHAKGLVCLPRGSVGAGAAPAAAAAGAGDAAAVSGEAGKADLVVGQGEDFVASVGAAASAAAGGAAASAAAGGSGAAASSAAGGAGDTATSTSGDAEAAAASGASTSHAASEYGGADVDVSGQGEATAITGDGTVISTGDGTAIATGGRIVDERFCTCVPTYLCGEDGYINTFGAGIIDIRSFADKPPPRDYHSKCKLTETCCRFRDKEPIGWQPSGCGERAPIRLDRRIVAGTAAGIGSFPWQVALLVQHADHTEYVCGGSLIAEDVVLTGAHCVHRHASHQLIARVGEWDTSSVDEVYPHDDIPVARVLEHEDFNDKTLFNDVALLKLSRPAEITTHVNTICLPDGAHFSFEKANCIATGWGKESFGDSQYPNILKEVHLDLVAHDVCELALRNTRLSSYFQLHDSFTCAGGRAGVDTCVGDGGSPLVCRVPAHHEGEPDTFVQVGIVAWGIGCGKGGVPGVYADVIKLLPWIQTHLPELTSVAY